MKAVEATLKGGEEALGGRASTHFDARMSIVVLNNHCHVQGGASRVAIDEAVGLADSGAQVVFVGATGPVCEELTKSSVRVICLGQSELALARGRVGVMLQGLWNRRAHSAVAQLLRSLDPGNTIVHLHGFSQALSTSPVRAALDQGFKVVCTLHDFFSACPNGGYFDFVEKKPCERRALSLDCISTNCDKRRYAHKLYRVARGEIQVRVGGLPRRVRNYISLSRRSEDILRPYLPADARIYRLENPVEVERSVPVEVAINRRVVAVGRLDVEKGVDVLVKAAREAGVQVTMIGDGPMRPYAESNGIKVTGWLARAEVMAELESARVLVFPSLWYETYGLAVAEAAGRGIPAIVSDNCAAAERVTDTVTGWHARAGDTQDLVRCLRLIGDDAVVRAAGRAAYDQFWSKPPTRQRHVAELTALYRDILAG